MQGSPWGAVQSKEVYARGINYVYTNSSSGFMISVGVVKNELTNEALLFAETYGGYYAFEENKTANIILFEMSNTRSSHYRDDRVLRGLSSSCPAYLIARKIKPLEPEYSNRKLSSKIQITDPNLILSATTFFPSKGNLQVRTAMGTHIVTAESFEKVLGPIKSLKDMIVVRGQG